MRSRYRHGLPRRFAGLMGLGLCIIAVLPHAVRLQADESEKPTTIRLVIDYGDGVEKHFTRLKWASNMTILDTLEAASEHPRGIRFKHRGQRSSAFLTEIDGKKNEGTGRNWMFRVNGKYGKSSFATHRLAAGDTVLWRFQKYEYNR